MKVVAYEDVQSMLARELTQGDVFEYDGRVFLTLEFNDDLDGVVEAANVETGEVEDFMPDLEVSVYPDAECHIRPKRVLQYEAE